MHLKIFVQTVFSILFIAILSSCNKAEITYYNKKLKSNKIACLSYSPKSRVLLDNSLESMYSFKSNCRYKLELSYKSDIVCNSPYNYSQKTTTNFPSAYLNLEVKKGFNLEYSYYIDLTQKPTVNDLKKAFDRLRVDILI